MQYNPQAIVNHIQDRKLEKNLIVVVINSTVIHAEVIKTLSALQNANIDNVQRHRLQRVSVGEYKLLFTTIEYYNKLRETFTDFVTFFQDGVNHVGT